MSGRSADCPACAGVSPTSSLARLASGLLELVRFFLFLQPAPVGWNSVHDDGDDVLGCSGGLV